jgi:hypothetical protein
MDMMSLGLKYKGTWGSSEWQQIGSFLSCWSENSGKGRKDREERRGEEKRRKGEGRGEELY